MIWSPNPQHHTFTERYFGSYFLQLQLDFLDSTVDMGDLFCTVDPIADKMDLFGDQKITNHKGG